MAIESEKRHGIDRIRRCVVHPLDLPSIPVRGRLPQECSAFIQFAPNRIEDRGSDIASGFHGLDLAEYARQKQILLQTRPAEEYDVFPLHFGVAQVPHERLPLFSGKEREGVATSDRGRSTLIARVV
ncbi:hypothetical protein RRF57_001035 [Xylaria bambusicola]|uniref:Uncharacterized protein n=1 Tax=Xylaria bambusicola TaxID=326684 RepID=A0AAN7UFQ5_9PEZI